MPDRLPPMIRFPNADAPIREWCRPVSAKMVNRREATGNSTADPENRRGHGVGRITAKRIQGKLTGKGL